MTTTSSPAWPVTVCGSRQCGAPIIWARTEHGARTPVDATPSPDGRWLLTQVDGIPEPVTRYVKAGDRDELAGRLHVAHWANCPDRNTFRTRSTPRQGGTP
jgi:hypothetical protein